MQGELDEEYPDLDIKILSINQIGAENGTSSFSEIHALPMVNDNPTDDIWTEWDCEWRDFYILNKNNELLEVYNLTEHNLNDPVNYEELKQKLVVASESE